MSKESFWDLWEMTKEINTCITRSPRKESRKEAERLKDRHPDSRSPQDFTRLNIKRPTLRQV